MGRLTPDGPPGADHRELQKKMDRTCYEKAQAREQLTFTVVEQDVTASRTVLAWIGLNWETAPVEKLRDAFEDALAMQHSPITKKHAD